MANKDKVFSDLHRLLGSKDFKDENELNEFLDGLGGKQIPGQEDQDLSDEERAQDMIFEARELPPKQGKGKAREALRLNSSCIEAYEYLGEVAANIGKAISYFKTGIAIGRKRFGGTFMEENKGHFYGIFETRPFMRCLFGYADCLHEEGEVEECVSVLEELIELNPNDNQGVRDQLGLYYLQLNELEKFKKLNDAYSEDIGAFHSFNLALYIFRAKGRTQKANEQLRLAMKENEYVVSKLIHRKPVEVFPRNYGYGDENEALYYNAYAQPVWWNTLGAVAWLKDRYKKMQRD